MTRNKDQQIQFLQLQLNQCMEESKKQSIEQKERTRKGVEEGKERTIFLKYCELKQENRKLKTKLKKMEREDHIQRKDTRQPRNKAHQTDEEKVRSKSVQNRRTSKLTENQRTVGKALPSLP